MDTDMDDIQNQNLTPRTVKMYPIMDGPSVPWEVMVPHERQAMTNHGGQTLERLAARGGLACGEAWCVIQGKHPGYPEKAGWEEYRRQWLAFADETNKRYCQLEIELKAARLAQAESFQHAEAEAHAHDECRKELNELMGQVAAIDELHAVPGSMEAHIKMNPGLSEMIGMCFASIVAKSPNYTEMTYKPRHGGACVDGQEVFYTVTVQKVEGLTPHQLRLRAEQERDHIRGELAELAKDRMIEATPEHNVGTQSMTFRNAANAIWNKINISMSLIEYPNHRSQLIDTLKEARSLADSIVQHPRSGGKD